MEINNIGEYFGTLQTTFVKTWREHLKTNKYSKHIALNEFYDEIPELLDSLIEEYIGIHGEVEGYKNIYDTDGVDAREYLKEMRQFVKDGRDKFFKEDTELCSDVDAILSLIDQTLYKLEQLVESRSRLKSLSSFVMEALNESRLEDYYFLGSTENGDEQLTLTDSDDNAIEFDPKQMEKILKQCRGWDNQKFIDMVFSQFPEADHINLEYSYNNEEPKIAKYAWRGWQPKGWVKN